MANFEKFTTKPVLDDEAIKRIDDDFKAGKLDHLLVTPIPELDEATDPLGMNFEWLNPSEDELRQRQEAVLGSTDSQLSDQDKVNQAVELLTSSPQQLDIMAEALLKKLNVPTAE